MSPGPSPRESDPGTLARPSAESRLPAPVVALRPPDQAGRAQAGR